VSNRVKQRWTHAAKGYRRVLAHSAAMLLLCSAQLASASNPITWNTVDGKRRVEFILNGGHICVLEDDHITCIPRPQPRPDMKR